MKQFNWSSASSYVEYIYFATLMWILGVGSLLSAFKPLQDDIIKRAPVEVQTMENRVENMMEISDFYVFSSHVSCPS